MRLVLDTNTAISGLLWAGTPGRIIDSALAGQVELHSSTALLVELKGVLAREKFARQLARRGLTVDDIFNGYSALVSLTRPAVIVPTIARDPADDEVLAAAVGCTADLIVSGDAHLLDLKSFRGIPIITAAVAVKHLA